MTTGLRFFYRHIYVTGLENIPSKGPVIIIANHNSSLMDAALLGILLKRKAYFFARGDVFVNKFVQTILWRFHMMPVHRYDGGRKSLGVNSGSFSEGQKILLKGGIIVFFPESTSHIEHQLLPFRKGVFRLAFDTVKTSNFSFDIPVVPIGITYDHPVNCRTSVGVHAGKPLLLSAYKKEYAKNPATALLHICRDAYQAIEKLSLHLADDKRLKTAGEYFIISRNNNKQVGSAWKIASIEKFDREKAICNSLNNAAAYEFENKQQKADSYFDALSAVGVTDKTISGNHSFPFLKRVMLWIGFPVYLLGLLLNGLPILIARKVADKKVYREDFYSWIFAACYSFMYLFWLIGLLIIGFLFRWQYGVALFLIMIVTGIFSYVYKDWLQKSSQQRKLKALPVSRTNELTAMRDCI